MKLKPKMTRAQMQEGILQAVRSAKKAGASARDISAVFVSALSYYYGDEGRKRPARAPNTKPARARLQSDSLHS